MREMGLYRGIGTDAAFKGEWLYGNPVEVIGTIHDHDAREGAGG